MLRHDASQLLPSNWESQLILCFLLIGSGVVSSEKAVPAFAPYNIYKDIYTRTLVLEVQPHSFSNHILRLSTTMFFCSLSSVFTLRSHVVDWVHRSPKEGVDV